MDGQQVVSAHVQKESKDCVSQRLLQIKRCEEKHEYHNFSLNTEILFQEAPILSVTWVSTLWCHLVLVSLSYISTGFHCCILTPLMGLQNDI